MARITGVSNRDMIGLTENTLSPIWNDRIPKMAQEYWENAKLVITSDNYAQARSEIFSSLVMRIGLTIVHGLETRNPLSVFDESEMFLYGETMQEIGTDIIKGEQFQGVLNPQDQFRPSVPEVQAAYHKINRRQKYRTTLVDPTLRTAFTQEGGLANLFAQFIKRLHDSNTVDRYIFFKQIFADLLDGKSGAKLLPSQIIEIPDIRLEDCPPDKTRTAILRAKNAVSQAQQNFTGFNQMRFTQAASKGSLCSVLDFRAQNQNVTQNLAQLFNPQYSVLDLQTNIEVDNFGRNVLDVSDPQEMKTKAEQVPSMGDNLIWAVVDKQFIQSRKVLSTITNSVNAESLYANFFLHDHEIFSVSPFKTAIFFVKEGTKKDILKAQENAPDARVSLAA